MRHIAHENLDNLLMVVLLDVDERINRLKHEAVICD